ncbi:hypothetical protein MKW94_023654 [Papaver nudicaule]|uniref:Uncharacterized protein n=1 Tax=Papaver nudicaule TaxID=74823 RepID=A0AA42AQV9_PAPNU|nr:hypothetical protein [Papaver nudicaule]
MQRFGSQGEEFYFDSVDYVRDSSASECESSEESVSGGVFGYGIWTNEPGSVKERRKNFLQGMGMGEFVDSELDFSRKIDEEVSRSNLGWERITECSGAVSSSSGLDDDSREEEDFVCCRKDPESRTEVLASKLVQKRLDETSISKVPATELDQHRFDRMPTPRSNKFGTPACGEKFDKPTKKKVKSWWKRMMCKSNGRGGVVESNVSGKSHDVNRMKVQNNKKTCVEFTAVYMDQEVEAHKGFVWTMKFSPDGQFLASGGEDGVVRIWRVTSTIALEGGSKFVDRVKDTKHFLGRKNSNPASVVIPKKVFKIEESPVQEFRGHTSDVLDICWSKSNCLLSSSKDNTVRLWQVGSDECRQIFHHNNYVTCIQFNPVNDAYFISGSIDGKVRIWGVSEKRVVDWADVRDIVTAICYQPNGKGFIVGSIKGRCRFYDTSGTNLQMNAQIRIHCRKKSSNNRITSFQFSPEDSHKIMITSADSKVRIFDGSSVIQKYKGLRRSGSQLSASYTSNGRHIISVGEDSHVYVWSCDEVSDDPSSKHTKSTRSCEHFFYEGVSVAIPWSGPELDPMELSSDNSPCFSQSDDSFSCSRDSDRFAFGGWFSVDNRGSVTWPEEKLLPWDLSGSEQHHRQHEPSQIHSHEAPSESWGLVIVTAGWDGKIRTFHNYGLPVRLEKSSKSCKS